MKNNIEQILINHLTAFGNNDLAEILKDYDETSIIFTPNGIVKGLDSIKTFFKEYFTVIPKGSDFIMNQKIIDGNVAYIVWKSNSNIAEILLGTDTIIFKDSKIQYHTVADYRTTK